MKSYIKDNKITMEFNEIPFQENFTVLNKNTKKAKNYIERFEKSYDFDIFDCYKKPSYTKQSEFFYWRKRAREFDSSIKIISFNSSYFSIGFETEIENQSYLLIATPFNNYAIVL